MRINLIDKLNRLVSFDLYSKMTFILGLSGDGKTSFVNRINTVVTQNVWDKSGVIKHIKINKDISPLDSISLGTLIILDEDSMYLNRAWDFVNNFKDVWVIVIGHGPAIQGLLNTDVSITKVVRDADIIYLEYLVHPDIKYIPEKIRTSDIVLITEDSGSGESILTQAGFKCLGSAGCQRIPRMINFVRSITDLPIIALVDEDTSLSTLEFIASSKIDDLYCFIHSSTEKMLLEVSPTLNMAYKSLKELSIEEAFSLYTKYISTNKSIYNFTVENMDYARLIYTIKECSLGYKLKYLKSYNAFDISKLGITKEGILDYLFELKSLDTGSVHISKGEDTYYFST